MAPEVVGISLILLLVLIALGWHIVLALTISTLVGVYLMFGNVNAAFSLFASTAFEALRDYVFAVIPLFILMGEFLARSGAAADIYNVVDRLFRKIPGRLGVATVTGNAIFAAATGVSIASAAAFTQIAYPHMVRSGYRKSNAIGVIAGSACLGMLIPPSVLMIVWGILTEQSIGHLFMAGVIPGIVLALLFAIYVVVSALRSPADWGSNRDGDLITAPPRTLSETFGVILLFSLIALVIGGIWGGLFTATEAAGVGAIGGLAVALLKGMKWSEVGRVIVESGRKSAPIMALLIVGQLYARLLSLGGANNFIADLFGGADIGPWLLICGMVIVWLILGCFLDSVSIMLITVPIFAPLAVTAGWDPLAFAIIGILAIEAGLLTPPFGILVFAIKGFLEDDELKLSQLFRAAVPYWIIILVAALLVAVFPGLASWLPSAMFAK